jgi:CubicO group peptidase (beta-lactamase class C family)
MVAKSSTATQRHSAQVLDELRAIVEPIMAERVVPGVAVGLVSREGDVLACFGITNVEHPMPVHEETVFQIASITKTLTSVAIMRLVEDGQIDLDAPVRTYLPDFRLKDPEATRAVSLKHMLTHAGGFFADYFTDTGPGDDALAKYVATLADAPQLYPPGTMWAAGNADFCVAGRVIEVLAGDTYERAVAKLVIDPLGMKRSFFFMSDAATHRLAAGHFVVDGHAIVTRPKANVALRPIAIIPRSTVATGGLLSTVRDMTRYTHSLLGDEPILSRASLELMGSPLIPGAWDQWRGIPWMLRELGGTRVLVHGGGGARSGQRALLTLAPSKGTGVITLTNSPTGAFVHDAVAEWWVRRVVGVESADERPTDIGSISPTGATTRGRPGSAAELAPYVGAYKSPDTDVDVRLRADGYLDLHEHTRRRLISSYEKEPPQPPPARIALCGKDRFVVTDGPTTGAPIEFLRDEGGAIEWIWMDHGRIHKREMASS